MVNVGAAAADRDLVAAHQGSDHDGLVDATGDNGGRDGGPRFRSFGRRNGDAVEGCTRSATLGFVGITSGQPSHPAVVAVGDAGGVGVARTVLVNQGCVEFHVGSRCSRTLVLVGDADVVVVTVLGNGSPHAVIVYACVHTATTGKETVVGGVLIVGTALSLVGSVAKVGIWSTASGPSPVVGSDVASTRRVGLSEGSRHVGDVHVLVRMVLLDGVVGVRTPARL